MRSIARYFVTTLTVLTSIAFCVASVHAQDSASYSATLNEFRPLALAGNTDAQFLVALAYYRSNIDGDLQSAEYWFEKAAQQGHMSAQLYLGDLYRKAGPMQNYFKANLWLKKAAEQGDSVAQYVFGTMFYHGYGVEKNYSQALQWFEKSANQGEVRAQGILGNIYFQGQGVPQNYLQSIYWFQKAGSQGDPLAMKGLGLIYEAGFGVEKSLFLAHVMYNLALANGRGSDDLKLTLLQIEKQLPASQVVQAQEMATRWKVGTPLPSNSSPPKREIYKKRAVTS